jgi:hypothetical protein
MWVKAGEYFKKVANWDMLARCFMRLEQWQELRLLAETKIADTSRELLSDIGACVLLLPPFALPLRLSPRRLRLQERRPC